MLQKFSLKFSHASCHDLRKYMFVANERKVLKQTGTHPSSADSHHSSSDQTLTGHEATLNSHTTSQPPPWPWQPHHMTITHDREPLTNWTVCKPAPLISCRLQLKPLKIGKMWRQRDNSGIQNVTTTATKWNWISERLKPIQPWTRR